MKGLAASFFLAAAGLSALPASAAAEDAAPLAKPMDVGFRTCAQQLTQPDFLTSANSAAFAAAGVTLDGAVPDQVRTLATAGIADPIFASIAAADAQIWIVASRTGPLCKVTLANTRDALRTRLAIEDAFRKTTAWTYDTAASGTADGMMVQAFVLNPAAAGPRMVMVLNGPNEIFNDGEGIQTIMTVAIVKAKAE